MTYEFVLPDMDRQNNAEKAIQTLKDHFMDILSGMEESFPMHLWDRLLPQVEMTLNMLRQTNAMPLVLAYACMHGLIQQGVISTMGVCIESIRSNNYK